LDFTVELTASAVAVEAEKTLTLTAAHLYFTQNEFRGNV
jgi:hypothetical protein